jgi:hypothetical protein
MTHDDDIRSLLDRWSYDPDRYVRVLDLENGRKVLQVRLPSGIEQYEMDGRPDGKRPHGMDSALTYYQQRAARRRGEGDPFVLSPGDCAALFEEGILYYYRYLHLFQVEDWDRTVRDTAHNLTLFDLVHRYAEREEDRNHLEQWRPYLLRMHATASAMIQLRSKHYDKALRLVNDAAAAIGALEDVDDAAFSFERRRSLRALQEMAKQIEKAKPLREVDRLEHQLHMAVEAEEFERAADLRDQIRSLRQGETAVGRTD